MPPSLPVTEHRYQYLLEHVRVLHAAIEELDQKMEQWTDTKGEWVTGYTMPVGPWHRIMGVVRGSFPPSYVEDRLDANAPTPEQITAEVERGGK